jgi:hypothetical protein
MARLDFWGYLKEAFHLKVRLPLLGYMPLNKMLLAAFAVGGLAHPAVWFLGLAYEAAYLTFLPGNERFQKVVDGRKLQEEQARTVRKQVEIYGELDRASQERYQRLQTVCADILRAVDHLPGRLPGEELKAGGMAPLLQIFLRLLHSRLKIMDILTRTDEREIRRNIADLEERLKGAAEGSPMQRSLKGSLEIQNRRLENLVRAGENLKVLESELDRIENQMNLVREEMAVNSDPALISTRLDGVMDSLQGTTRWMTEHAELFGPIEETALPEALGPASWTPAEPPPAPRPRRPQKEG